MATTNAANAYRVLFIWGSLRSQEMNRRDVHDGDKPGSLFDA
jgi:hypothetical protein